MSVLRRVVSLAALLGVAAAAPSAAADEPGLEGLLSETIITTASKTSERGSTAPATSTILTAEDIRQYGLHSIDEAINFLALGVVTQNPMRAVDIGARGVLITHDQGDHFLLLIDGHAVNEPLYGAARFGVGAGVPMELVDHIEVILGPGSVLYGSNAMLGVINVVTKRARDFHGTHVVAESEIAKSWRVASGVGYEPELFGVPSELTLELEYFRQKGPAFDFAPQPYQRDWTSSQPWRFSRDGAPTGIWGGEASHSYYGEVPAGMLKFRVKDFELLLHASTYKRASPSNHLFMAPESDFDDPNNYELDRSAFAELKYQRRLTRRLLVTARVYGDTFDYQRYTDVSARGACLFTQVTTCRDRAMGASRWTGAEAQTSWDWLGSDSLVSLLGVDGRWRHVAARNDRFDFDTGEPLQSSTGVLRQTDGVVGAYLEQTWRPAESFGMNLGGRMDYDRRFGIHLSPRAAASVQAWEAGTLKAIYSEAFRAPSWEETDWSSRDQIPADRLRPETVRSIEAVLDQRLGPHRLVFGVFRSVWNDLVEPHVLGAAEVSRAQAAGLIDATVNTARQFRNVASIENYGFNAGYTGTLGGGTFRYGADVTGANARRAGEDGTTGQLTVAPELFGNVRVAYSLPSGWPTIAMAGSYVGRRPSDAARGAAYTAQVSAPPQLELRGTLSGAVVGVTGLSYRLSANYAFASRGPYLFGPQQSGFSAVELLSADMGHQELNPVDRFRVSVGLQYDFGSTR